MKNTFSENKNAADGKKNSATQPKVALAQWQALADFRSRSAHQQVHRPAARIRLSLLRDVTFVFVFWLQVVLQPVAGSVVDDSGARGIKSSVSGK